MRDWEQWELFSLSGAPTSASVNARNVVTNPYLRVTPDAVSHFWRQVVKGPGEHCWIWVGAISTPDGYGRISWQVDGQRRTLSSHRFALLLDHDDVLPDGVVGEHSCCEPLCVRVGDEHLRLTTQSANISYAVARGRHNSNKKVVDSDQRAGRSFRVRAAVKDGWNLRALRVAQGDFPNIPGQAQLW